MVHLINNVNKQTTTAEIFDNLFSAYDIDCILERLDSMMYDYLYSTEDKGNYRAISYDLNMKLRALIIVASREKEARGNELNKHESMSKEG